MNRSEALFKAIDILFHPLQNYIKVKGVKIEKDVSYDDRYSLCKADLIFKESADKQPVLINIHGGGFVKGDKRHRRSICEMYADKGWFVVNANYRLCPAYPFPAFMHDIFKFLNFLPSLAEKYNLDLSRLVITGDSAGGYASAMTMACIADESLRKDLGLPDAEVKPAGIVCLCGTYDMVAYTDLKMPFGFVRSVVESVTGSKFKKDYSDISGYKYFRQINPTNYVNKDWCPVFLSYSEKDIFCPGQGQRLYKLLKEAGVPCFEAHSTKITDNHCYHFNYWTKASKDTLKAVYEFLDKVKNGEKFDA